MIFGSSEDVFCKKFEGTDRTLSSIGLMTDRKRFRLKLALNVLTQFIKTFPFNEN